MIRYNLVLLILSALLILAACGQQDTQEQTGDSSQPSIPVIAETWLSERNEADNVDSPAVWHGPDGEHWVISTCKATDQLLINDAATGDLLRRVGSSGSGAGQFLRPNGIAVVDDLAIVVERDNHRLQVFRLPDWESAGFFGADDLILPYGIAVRRDGAGYLLYVTDNYETADEQVPPDSLLGERVKVFAMQMEDGKAIGTLRGRFGATEGAGVLYVVESIAIDTVYGRILVADEDARSNDIKVYDLDGRFNASIVGDGLFQYQPEGIVLYSCRDGSGYWITTDQSETDNTFHIFDRKTLEHIASFKAVVCSNTDGIALTQRGFGPFPDGAFFAVHNDGNVGALDWSIVADSLQLPLLCTE
ncbi:MAG: phytase, partial [Bacteroidetes bacterium]|nr:phytase [Bacteroidota bacterium]